MAWAEKLPSGKYRGVYRDALGHRRSAGTFPHKAKAERAAAAKEQSARKFSSGNPDAYRRPWGEWADEWWPTRCVAPTTLKVDENRRKGHLDPQWGKVPLGSITRHDVKAWAAGLATQVSPETVKRCVHLLSASLNAAVDAQILEANPASRISLPSGPPARERFLTRAEFDKVREQLPTTDDVLVVDLLAYTGLRWGELTGLHWTRVDLKRGVLRVVETWDEVAARSRPTRRGSGPGRFRSHLTS